MTSTKDSKNSFTDYAEPQIVTLPGEGGDVDCEILLTFDYGGRDIIALMPVAPDGGDGGAGEPPVLLYGYAATELDDGDISLQFTEIPDREFDGVLHKFESILAGR